MAGLERLHPHLQHAIVHELGWRSLRPVQEATIDAVLDGANAVVLAPTAGGKTEAAIFPLLSRIVSEEQAPVAVLYVCPIRALLNNQEERLQNYARMVGVEVFKWHGDVADSKKQRFRREPKHILMTTPESLEVMLISQRTDARALFAHLSAVVVDEVHAFAGDDRGGHLASVLERLTAFCGRDIQRIGLSATVGNPRVIGKWLQGSSQRPFRLVDPPKPQAERLLRIEFAEELADAAAGIAQLARGKKSLVFVESRSKAERVAQALQGTGVEVFIHHSSVSRAERTLAEAQFARGENTAIVCTSTMELGIDVGDLDQVLQVDAPSSVASFLQRMGRTGRRDGTRANCTFFCLSGDALLQAVALLRLAERGWVEDVKPPALAMHILAHQILALVLQEDGLSRYRLLPWVEAAYPFSAVREDQLLELVDTMVAREILYEADGVLSLGRQGEKLYGRRHFFELYAVFTAPPMMRVRHGRTEVGFVQSLFVAMQDQRQEGSLCFRLSGKSWEVGKIEWNRGIVHVHPAKRGRVPSWLGLPGALSTELCQAMMAVLIEPSAAEESWLSREARLELEGLRAGYEGLLEVGTAPLESLPEGVQWHTFAGGAVNRLLGAGLEGVTGRSWTAGNLSLRCKEASLIEAQQAVAKLAALDWEHVAAGAARGMARGTVSKFQPCLPQAAEDRLLTERLLDVPGTLRFLGRITVNGRRAVSGPAGQRLKDAEPAQPVVLEVPAPPSSYAYLTPQNPIRWVDSAERLQSAVQMLLAQDVIGLDVETLGFGPLCLIQLATASETFIVDPFAVGNLEALVPLLGAERPTKIIHHASFERRVLGAVGLPIDGVFDTFTASRDVRGDALGGHGLAAVCERELGMSVDKSEQCSSWSRRPLSPEQLRYAALDAEVLIALERALRVAPATQSTPA